MDLEELDSEQLSAGSEQVSLRFIVFNLLARCLIKQIDPTD
jgi:hypothetical protein